MPELKQRSQAWRIKRLGMVTASRFGDVMTQPRAKKDRENGVLSATAESYLHDCLAEMVTGVPLDRFTSRATDWGTEWESEAFAQAAEKVGKLVGTEPELPEGQFAFFEHPVEKWIGCSPDGIIGDDALLEIKCGFNPRTHMDTVLAGRMPEKHKAQVQGSLWVTGRQFYVFVSFDPRYEESAIDALFLNQVERDEDYIQNELAPAVLRFRDRLQEAHRRLTELYLVRKKSPF